MRDSFVHDGILGLVVGDALGVPVEFFPREALVEDPVVDMRSMGTYSLPAGTWSDDSSLTLCLAESLNNGLDYTEIMKKFEAWLRDGYMTPSGTAFGVGRTTLRAIEKYQNGTNPLDCGGINEYDNGNGSLMRILPIAFYVMGDTVANQFEITHNVSALTHAHPIAKMACGIYVQYLMELLNNRDKSKVDNFLEAYKRCRIYYNYFKEFAPWISYFKDVFYLTENYDSSPEIKSSGYAIDTLKAAIWSFLSTDSYSKCVLRAVNLGEDTDTVAAVAGGLAGTYYTANQIPEKWLEQIRDLDKINEICDDFYVSLRKIYVSN